MVIKRLCVVVVAAFLVVAAVGAVCAADNVGYVNVQDVFQGYEKTTKSNSELDDLSKALVAKLQVMEENLLLPNAELTELIDLSAKTTRTDQENSRVKAIQDHEVALDKELGDLTSKKEPTAQEQARLKELQGSQSKSKEAADALRADSEKKFQDRSQELSKGIRDDIIKAIEEVAKDKKMTMVVDKEAVLFGGVDITKEVLAKLGKK